MFPSYINSAHCISPYGVCRNMCIYEKQYKNLSVLVLIIRQTLAV